MIISFNLVFYFSFYSHKQAYVSLLILIRIFCHNLDIKLYRPTPTQTIVTKPFLLLNIMVLLVAPLMCLSSFEILLLFKALRMMVVEMSMLNVIFQIASPFSITWIAISILTFFLLVAPWHHTFLSFSTLVFLQFSYS